MIQSNLESLISRDDSYKETIMDEDTNIKRSIIKKILLAHPEGITDLEICDITGYDRNIVNARRNEIKNVVVCGFAVVEFKDGRNRLNAMWGIENGI